MLKRRKLICAAALYTALNAVAADLSTVRKNLLSAGSFRCTFEQRRYLKGQTVPLESVGTLKVRQNSSVLWHQTDPFDQKIFISGGSIRIEVEGDPVEEISSENEAAGDIVKVLASLVSGDLKGLDETFETKSFEETADGGWRMNLCPKTELMKRIFREIGLRGSRTIEAVVLFESAGDRTEIEFSDRERI